MREALKLPSLSEKDDKKLSLSKNGRVVVIDDKWEETENLIKSLARLGVPCCYFDGSMDSLPKAPLKGVRFLFLDIELGDTVSADNKSKASALAARVLKIIGKSNGPYFIVFWTLHKEVIGYVLDYLRPKIPPVQYIDLEKPPRTASKDEKSILALTKKIEERITDIGAFRLYVAWESILNSAGIDFVNNFSSLVPLDSSDNGPKKWSEGTSNLFHKLSETYSSDNLTDPIAKFKNACTLLNQSFSDTLQRFTQKKLCLPQGFDLKAGALDRDVISKINTALFIDFSYNLNASTGAVFFISDDDYKNDLQKAVFKKNTAPPEVQLCSVIVTPVCDLAHNDKTFNRKAEGKDVVSHRIVFGLCFVSPDTNNKIKKMEAGDARFLVGPFWHEEKSKIIIFHFGTLSESHELAQKNTPVFSLKRELIYDLQSKAANHVNRLGNFQLKITEK